MQRDPVGGNVPHAESKKLFQVFDADKYFLLERCDNEESTPVARNAPVRQPGQLFGSPINFRGLRHAPINELGVVYIFGMVSYELGFIVEGSAILVPRL